MIFFYSISLLRCKRCTKHETKWTAQSREINRVTMNAVRPYMWWVVSVCARQRQTHAAVRKRGAHVRSTPKDTRCQYSRERKKKREKKNGRWKEKKKEKTASHIINSLIFFLFLFVFFVSYAVIYGMSSETFMANGKKRKTKMVKKNIKVNIAPICHRNKKNVLNSFIYENTNGKKFISMLEIGNKLYLRKSILRIMSRNAK